MIDKKLLVEVNRLSMLFHDKKRKLDAQIFCEYGYHYSDINADFIIDCLDYGNDLIDFETFKNEMADNTKLAVNTGRLDKTFVKKKELLEK